MKKVFGFLLLVVALAFLVSCSGGSSSGGSTTPVNGSAPELKSMTIAPNSAQRDTVVQVNFAFDFSDNDGDLDGGSINFSDATGTQTIVVPASYAGHKTGTGVGQITTKTSSTPGQYTYTAWLLDKKGNKSNTVTVTFTVT